MDYLNEYLFFGKGKKNDLSVRYARKIKVLSDRNIFNTMCNDYCNVHKWKYTGDGRVDTTVIERTIMYDGFACVTKYQGYDYVFRALPINHMSFYGYPNSVQLLDFSGRKYGTRIVYQPSDVTQLGDCVLIYANINRTKPMQTIVFFHERLSAINTQIQACLNSILGTTIIATEDEQQRAVENMLQKAKLGVPVVIKATGYGNFTTSVMNVPDKAETLKTLYEAYDKTYSDYLQAIGVSSNNEINKKSGVTPTEITADRHIVGIRLNDGEESRQIAVNQMQEIGITGFEVDNYSIPIIEGANILEGDDEDVVVSSSLQTEDTE